MNLKLGRRFGNRTQQKSLMSKIADEAGYLILAVISLLASAVAIGWSEQLLTVAIIFGWKWICGNQSQVIQIFTHDEKEYK